MKVTTRAVDILPNRMAAGRGSYRGSTWRIRKTVQKLDTHAAYVQFMYLTGPDGQRGQVPCSWSRLDLERNRTKTRRAALFRALRKNAVAVAHDLIDEKY